MNAESGAANGGMRVIMNHGQKSTRMTTGKHIQYCRTDEPKSSVCGMVRPSNVNGFVRKKICSEPIDQRSRCTSASSRLVGARPKTRRSFRNIVENPSPMSCIAEL